ncbi:hypothetical protein LCGC14_2885060 [marine sediment metagenome]|uniref:Uncharacterized protein n=1 Tax=marine sediment metagenome TaxID=412755 RepID=A0A0F8YKQ5_9ZZZZ
MTHHILHAQGMVGLLCITAALIALSGCAARQGPRHPFTKWGVRVLGAVAAFTLHEGCHLTLGAVLGGNVNVRSPGVEFDLRFSNLSDPEHRAVAIAGNACTGIAAEIILWTDLQEHSDLAWGMVLFHAMNAWGYAFQDGGDRKHWESAGGNVTTWQVLHASHGALVAARLVYSEERNAPSPPPPTKETSGE